MIALTHNDNATSGLSTDAKSEGDTANLPSEDVLDEQPSEGGSKTTNSATRERGFGSSARSRHHSRTTSELRYSYGRYSNPRRTRYVPLQRLSRMILENKPLAAPNDRSVAANLESNSRAAAHPGKIILVSTEYRQDEHRRSFIGVMRQDVRDGAFNPLAGEL